MTGVGAGDMTRSFRDRFTTAVAGVFRSSRADQASRHSGVSMDLPETPRNCGATVLSFLAM